MQVHLGEDGNVEQHNKPHEVEVRESKVVKIWHFNAPLLRFQYVTLGPVEAQQLTGYSNWIQNDKCCVSRKRKF